jgi:hypothetical protein
MTTEYDAPTFLVLPAGYVFVDGRCEVSKRHITRGHGVGICGIVTSGIGMGRISPRCVVAEVCKKCIKAAQKKGLGVRYE